jgi:hypothetical protein
MGVKLLTFVNSNSQKSESGCIVSHIKCPFLFLESLADSISAERCKKITHKGIPVRRGSNC